MAAITTTFLQTPPMSPTSSPSSATTIMPSPTSSPTLSPTATCTKRRHAPSLSLDLSDLPQLSQPTPPSNTLIITNLNDPQIFTAANLASIKSALDNHATTYSFSPLKSFRRIIASFYTVEAAISIRGKLDGENVLGQRIRVYFGAETKVREAEDQHLKAPSTGKLFFISPPPSPPQGWESREEEPPNKDTHADDLAAALHRLSSVPEDTMMHVDAAAAADGVAGVANASSLVKPRSRADSRTIVYHPVEQGHSPLLPAIAVEDTSCEGSPVDETFAQGEDKPVLAHTARPPVELMES